MKRDWNAIRSILKAIELLPNESSQIESNMIPGLDPEIAAFNMRLLKNAGLIEGGCRNAIGPPLCYATAITWDGFEFLDAMRSERSWNRIKEVALEKGIDLSLTSIISIAKSLTEAML